MSNFQQPNHICFYILLLKYGTPIKWNHLPKAEKDKWLFSVYKNFHVILLLLNLWKLIIIQGVLKSSVPDQFSKLCILMNDDFGK